MIKKIKAIKYTKHPIPEFQGNPLIEALNPPPLTQDEAIKRLLVKPKFNEDERSLPSFYRQYLLSRLTHYMFPMTEHIHILLKIYIQVLHGYTFRNPLTAQGQEYLYDDDPNRKMPPSISFLTGLSGMGKSTLIRAIMKVIGSQTNCHSRYKGKPLIETQLLYLMRNVPDQKSTKQLCLTFGDHADALLKGNMYFSRFSQNLSRTENFMTLRDIIRCYHVGALIVDEFQNLSIGRSGGKDEIIALLLNISEYLGIPIILVGTYKAVNLLKGDASVAQRLVAGGFHELKRPMSQDDEDWANFADIMWCYQWVKKPRLMNDDIRSTLYECSQGIIRLMLLLFAAAQFEAINSEEEYVDADVILRVYRERFTPVHNIVDALKSQKEAFLNQYDDLYPRAFNALSGDPLVNRLTEMSNVVKEQEISNPQQTKKKAAPKPKKGAFDHVLTESTGISAMLSP